MSQPSKPLPPEAEKKSPKIKLPGEKPNLMDALSAEARRLGIVIKIEMIVPHDNEKHVDVIDGSTKIIVFDGKTKPSDFMPHFKGLLVEMLAKARSHKPVTPTAEQQAEAAGIVVPQKPKLILPE